MSQVGTSARDAALRVILEDLDPVLKQQAELAQTLATVRGELSADLRDLGAGMGALHQAHVEFAQTAKRVEAIMTRIEAFQTVQLRALVDQAESPRKPSLPWWQLAAVAGGCGVVQAALLLAVR